MAKDQPPPAPAGGGQQEEEEEKGKKKKKKKKEEEDGEWGSEGACCGCRFPLLPALAQGALGLSGLVLGILATTLSPSLPLRDTPYWAGILMCVVSILGFCMLCISYQVDEKTCIQFAMKLIYFLLSAFSMVICILAVAFAAHRYSQITQFACESVLDVCRCQLHASDEPLSRTFIYQDVADCTSVTGTFKTYLLVQMVLYLVGAFVSLLACFVMWKHRYQVFYVGVRLCSLTASQVKRQKV
ncbi:sarcospan isoform X1 [Tachyglossus aculeatus]|uniref:sarcospan isoform X1 n=2 Tax=Tachyglossus aculeatus TaxID=9261 RepID=UPI0018F472C9|nr:sarcospan isoform X1 [Tachyglossus aculeatus]